MRVVFRALSRQTTRKLLLVVVAIAVFMQAGTSTQSTTTTFQLRGSSSEISAAADGAAVVPAIGPTGTLHLTGTGGPSFGPVGTETGVAFLNGDQQVDNTSYYVFSGANVGNLFNLTSGSVSFNLKSRYSFAARKTISKRWVFDVYDANNNLFSFYVSTYSGYLMFNYNVGSTSTNTYFVPVGQEDILFGAGVVLSVRIAWSGSQTTLYLNNSLVQTTAYAPAAPNWTAASSFLIGAKQDLTYGPGWFSSDDWINEFIISGPPPTNPPAKVLSPSPANTSTGVSTTTTLSWAGSQGATGYDVYFGQGTLTKVSSNQAATAYTPATMTASTTYSWRVDAKNSAGTTTGDVWTFTTAAPPPPPGKPTNPSPANGSTGASVSTILSWTAGSGATAYDVYFAAGTTLPSSPTAANVTSTSWAPSAALSSSTQYSWRVDAKNSSGTTRGDVWTFTTSAAPPPPPPAATNPSPANLATNVAISTPLSWTGSAQATSYDIYIGSPLPSTPTAAGLTATSYAPPSALAYSTAYSWRVDSKNAGGTTVGSVWSFTTSPAPGVSAVTVTATADAPIHSLAPTTNYGSTDVATMYSGSTALFRFALPTLPTGAVVLGATLQLRDTGYDDGYPGAAGEYDALGVYRVTRDWTESAVTYNRASATVSWTTAGGDFDSTTDFGNGPTGLVAEALSNLSQTPETLSLDVTALVTKQYANTYPNYGFLIRQTTRNGGPMLCFRENADVTKVPTLVIRYTATTSPPSLVSVSPASGGTNVAVDTPISFALSDTVGIKPSSISLLVNGVQHGADVRVTGTPTAPTLTYVATTPFPHSTGVTANLSVSNLAGNTLTAGTSFTTAASDTVPPMVALAFPNTGATNVPVRATFTFKVIDGDAGVDRTTLSVKLNGADVTASTQILAVSGGYQLNYTPASPLPAGQAATFTVAACDLVRNCMTNYVDQVTVASAAQWMRGSIHQHSGDYSFDAGDTIASTANAVRSLGDQFLIFTQHQYSNGATGAEWTTTQLQSMSTNENALASANFAIVPGQEIFTTFGHTITYGVNWNQNPREVYDLQSYAMSQGGVFAFAHPEYPFCPCTPTHASDYRFLPDPLFMAAFTTQGSSYTTTADGWSTSFGFLAPGGLYDQMLAAGRKVFMYGETDYHGNAVTAGTTQALIYSAQPTAASVVDAMRSGRNYVSSSSTLTMDFSVNGFPVGSDIPGLAGPLTLNLNIAGTASGGTIDQITVIRDNAVFYTTSPAAPNFSTVVAATLTGATGRSYFRLVVVGRDSGGNAIKAVSNPIFVGSK